MNSSFQPILVGVFCVAALVLIRRGTKKNTLLGKFLRWWWNTSLYLASLIPLMGWIANFIIADTEEEIQMKEDRLRSGEQADMAALSHMEQRGTEEQRQQEEFYRLDTLARERYGSRLVSYDKDSGLGRLENGDTIRVDRY